MPFRIRQSEKGEVTDLSEPQCSLDGNTSRSLEWDQEAGALALERVPRASRVLEDAHASVADLHADQLRGRVEFEYTARQSRLPGNDVPGGAYYDVFRAAGPL